MPSTGPGAILGIAVLCDVAFSVCGVLCDVAGQTHPETVPDDPQAATIDFSLGPRDFHPVPTYASELPRDSQAGTIDFSLGPRGF